ncbi:MAG: hypothetical protein IKR87_06085 [Candidatus Methanomethylophilaceae archaeon]|nr:hypothetical protein [Candidatus Methanomethylophilaceae archaeon]
MMKMIMAVYDSERVQDAYITGGSFDVMTMLQSEVRGYREQTWNSFPDGETISPDEMERSKIEAIVEDDEGSMIMDSMAVSGMMEYEGFEDVYVIPVERVLRIRDRSSIMHRRL